jgi:RimJ/RimL family protein N-acetyltransferase
MAIDIRGPRVLLRRFTPADIPAMQWLVSDAGFHAAVEEMGSTEADVRRYLEERSGFEDFEQGKVSDLAVALIEGPVIGMVTLVRRLADQGEVGYALHGDYRGSGHATEAACSSTTCSASWGSIAHTSGCETGTPHRPRWPAGWDSASKAG